MSQNGHRRSARRRDGSNPTRIVILGGGFAGLHVARELSRLRAGSASNDGERDVELVLVNRENYFVFQPLLTHILSASAQPTHVVVPLRRMLPDVNVEVAEVTEIDTERRTVRLLRRHLDEPIEIGYDAAVVALGSVTNLSHVPGMAEHAIPLRTLGDAFFCRNHVLDLLEAADLETDPVERERLLSFVVVGGGATGVEVATALEELVTAAAATIRYPSRLRPVVRLVHSRARLLPETGDRLGRYATRKVAETGVRLVLGRRIASVDAGGVTLDDGDRIPAAAVISTVGNAPHPVAAAMAGRHDGGWLHPAPDLSLPGVDGVWALGDCSSVPDVVRGGRAPATAQQAVRQGTAAARNIWARLHDAPEQAFRYRDRGMLVSLGGRRAAGSVFGRSVSGFPAWLLWRGYYLSQLPSMDRRARVALDWILDAVLPRDVVQLDVHRTPGGDRSRPRSLEIRS